VIDQLSAIADKARALLQGEPLRAITWGAIVVVYLVVHAASAFGFVHTPPASLQVISEAVLVAIAAIVALLSEFSRQYVWSPASVAHLLASFGVDTAKVPVADATTDPVAVSDVVTPDPAPIDPAADPAPDPAPEQALG
jgi:hypothetical protein